MFSGIIEAQSTFIQQSMDPQALRLQIQRPPEFTDLHIGDSICTNGICLTIEKFDETMIQFCLGAETLKLLASTLPQWSKFPINLERSLRFGDRVHGHLVTGHVDVAASVRRAEADGECWQMQVEIPASLASFFWKKGSICLNGVSLTVNQVARLKSGAALVDVCLIPETLKKTNLQHFRVNDFIHVEADYLAKAYYQIKEGNMD